MKKKLCLTVLILLCIISGLVNTNQCSSSVDTMLGGFSLKFYYNDINRKVTNIVPSSDLSNIYIASKAAVDNPSTSFTETNIEKRLADFTLVWTISLPFEIRLNSIVLDSSDIYLYFSMYHPSGGLIGKISTSNGSIVSAYETDANLVECQKLTLSPNEMNLYLGCKKSGGEITITEITTSDLSISHSSKFSVDALLSLESYTKNQTYRSVIVGTFKSIGEIVAHYSYSFPSSSVNFGIKIGCTSASTNMRPAITAVMESTDLFAIGCINDGTQETLLLAGLTNGTYAGNYAVRNTGHGSSNRNIIGIGQLGDTDKIYMMSSYTSETLLWIYDISSKTFSTAYSGSREMTAISAKFGYFIMATHDATENVPYLYKIAYDDTYITKEVLSNADSLMDTSQTPTTVSVSSVTITPETSLRTLTLVSLSSTTNTVIQINMISSSLLNTRNSSYQTIYIPAGGKNTVNLTSPCLSTSGYTLSASLTANQNGESSPSWISLKDDFSAIIADAPEITNSQSTFYLGISFSYSSYVFTQYSTISLFECGISNCNGCEYDTKDTKCTQCKDGYKLSQDGKSCDEELLPTQALAITTTVVIAASASIGAASSIISSGSGSSSIWVVMNQYQLYLLFPLLQTYLPGDFVFYLTEFELFNFDFKFLEKAKIPGIESLVDDLDYSVPSSIFSQNGFSSGSFVVNQFQFFKAIGILGIFNFVFIGVYYLIPKLKNKECSKKIYGWLIPFFYFAAYIRMVIEAFLFAFISCLLEITTFSSLIKQPVSFCFSLVFVGCFVSLPFLIYHHFKKYNENGEVKELSKLSEFYEGYANGKKNKLYTIVFLTRRIATAVCLVCMRNTPASMICLIFFVIQLLHFQYLIFNRPFKSKKDNIIEVLNEVVFLTLTLIITLFQKESDWKEGMATALIMIVMINGLMVSFIIMVDSCINISKTIKICKSRQNRVETLAKNRLQSRNNAKEDVSAKTKVGVLPQRKQTIDQNSERMEKSYHEDPSLSISRTPNATKMYINEQINNEFED
ncbi:unnamed protein product [Moneuplotes crassus]|uniref:Uncharacterized protein n=1 Tax=Euplotes crassus TaxID=5936 RepID=A0AAD1XK89_EUPCR|nr:unnamed protein product [Moneuplotes crassus]